MISSRLVQAGSASTAARRSMATTAAVRSSSSTPKSVPASKPGVPSSPTPAEALASHSQTSAQELDPLPEATQARVNSGSGNQGRSAPIAESRPTVVEAQRERHPIDIAKAAPNLVNNNKTSSKSS